MKNETLMRMLMSLTGFHIFKKIKDVFLQQSRIRGSWVLGIDQGTSALRYVLWDKKSGMLVRYGRCELDRQDASGTKARLDSAGCFREIARGIPKNRLCAVQLNIQGSPLLLGFLEMAANTKSIQPSVFRHALSSHLPFPVEEAALVYREVFLTDLPESKESGRKAVVSYAACHKPVAERIVRSVQTVFGLVPDVTTQGYAQESLLQFLELGKPGELTAIISGGRSNTSISIIKDGQLLFEREIPLAGQDITRSIFIMHLQGQQTLRSAEDLKIAEQLKCQSVIPIAQTAGNVSPEKAEQENQRLYQAIQGVLSAWIQDVRLSFAYFNEHFDVQPIRHIYLAGGMANHKNLAVYLSRELGIAVQMLVWPTNRQAALSNVPLQEVFQNGFHEYATAFGLAVKPAMESSLTPREYYSADWVQIWQALLRVFVFTGSIFLAVSFFFLQIQENRLRSVKMAIDTHRTFLNKLEGPYQEMLKWENLLKRAEFSAPSAADFFQVLTRLTPPDLVLTGISYDRESGDILMEGVIYGDPRRRGVVMVEFSKVFKRDPRFRKVEVPLWESNATSEGKGSFRLSTQYQSQTGAGV
ncbi:MAG: hypothetical protein KBC91_00130 [Candidatus Omnitrophica bacterium]|nr:hypothetical protein [Candidatus Omnitrophota bacterium]